MFHKHDKLIGCHFDADNTIIMDQIGKTDLNYIEAYDPGISPPLHIARKVFRDKVLWINWPSAWHLDSPDMMKAKTVEMLKEIGKGDGFIIGVTEDPPKGQWQKIYNSILDGIDRRTSSAGPTSLLMTALHLPAIAEAD